VLLLTLFYIGMGVLLSVISIPLIQRRIKPNPFYGFRVPKAYKNEAIWYEINAYSGKRLFLAGIVVVVAAVLFALVPNLTVDVYSTLISIILAIAITIALLQSFRYLNQIAK